MGKLITPSIGDYKWYAWDKDEAEQWLKDNNYSTSDFVSEPNYYAYRQGIDKSKAEDWANQFIGPDSNPDAFDEEKPEKRPVKLTFAIIDGKSHTYAVSFYHGEQDLKDRENQSEVKGKNANIRSSIIKGIQFYPYLDAPILQTRRSKRSDGHLVPDGSVIVCSLASTEDVDYYGTIVDAQAVVDAFPGYMSNKVLLSDGTMINQGNLRYMHSDVAAGYCREYEFTNRGVLCKDIVPASKKSIQDEILDGIITGTSLGWNTLKYREEKINGVDSIRFMQIVIAERSLVDAPANPGCNFSELMERAKRSLGTSKLYFTPAKESEIEIASPVSDIENVTQSNQRKKVGSEVRMITFTWSEKDGWHVMEVRPESDFMDGTLRYDGEGPDGVMQRIGTLLEEKRQPPDEWGYQELSGVQAVCFNVEMWSTNAAEMYVKRDTWRLRRIEKEMAFSAGTLEGVTEAMSRARKVEKPSIIRKFVNAFKRAKTESPSTQQTNSTTNTNSTESDDDAALTELLDSVNAMIEESITRNMVPLTERMTGIESKITALETSISELQTVNTQTNDRVKTIGTYVDRLSGLPQEEKPTPTEEKRSRRPVYLSERVEIVSDKSKQNNQSPRKSGK